MIFRKIRVFIESDGWINTWHYIANAILSVLGRSSKTICLYGIRDKIVFKQREHWKMVSIKTITNVDEVEAIDFPRLKLQPYKKWLEQGSLCHILYIGERPVAFSWVHFRRHRIDKVGTFILGDKLAWLGPYFVHRQFRGMGLQQLLLQLDINEVSSDIRAFITSVNFRNIASLKSFKNLGFQEGAISWAKRHKVKIEIADGAKSYFNLKK